MIKSALENLQVVITQLLELPWHCFEFVRSPTTFIQKYKADTQVVAIWLLAMTASVTLLGVYVERLMPAGLVSDTRVAWFVDSPQQWDESHNFSVGDETLNAVYTVVEFVAISAILALITSVRRRREGPSID